MVRPHDLALQGRLDAAGEPSLADRLVRGDPSAFEALVAAHQSHVARLAQRLLGWRADADDVVQEVFLAAWRQIGRFRGQSTVRTWLTAITIRRCRTWQRRQWLRWRWLGRQRQAPGAAGADQPAIRDELAEQVRQAVRNLAPADREVIVLYYLEQLSVKTISKLLRTTPNAIDVRLHRARQRLRTALGGIVEEHA